MMPDVNTQIDEMDYESAFAALQEVVSSLEGQQLALEESMRLFERGQQLAQRCGQLLAQAELKMQTLLEVQDQDLDEAA